MAVTENSLASNCLHRFGIAITREHAKAIYAECVTILNDLLTFQNIAAVDIGNRYVLNRFRDSHVLWKGNDAVLLLKVVRDMLPFVGGTLREIEIADAIETLFASERAHHLQVLAESKRTLTGDAQALRQLQPLPVAA